MNSQNFDSRDLLKEKKLWDIYLSSRRIPYSRFNVITTLVIILLLVLKVWCCNTTIDETIETIRRFGELGLNITLNTLGFLLAGFTIFATVSQPLLLVSMAKINHPDSGLSYLKHNFFIFMRVFIYYLTFAAFCLLIISSLLKSLVRGLPDPSFLVSLNPSILCACFFFQSKTHKKDI